MATNRTDTSTLRLVIDGQQVNNSFKDLNATASSLKKEMKGLEVGSAEYIKKSQQLNQVNKRLDEVKQNIKEVGDEWKQTQDDFKKGVNDGINNLTLFGTNIGNLRSSFSQVTGSTVGWIRQLGILKSALIASGIGLFVVVFGSLIKYLTATEEGMDRVSSVLVPLKTIFERFVGVIQQLGKAVFESIGRAFKDPVGAIKDLGKAIEENVVNRFKALALFGPAIAKIFSGDIVDGFKDLGNATIQLGTGVEEGLQKMAAAAKATGEFFKEGYEQGSRLFELSEAIEDLELEQIRRQGKLRRQFDEAREAALDATKSEEERTAAVNKAMAIQSELTGMSIKLLDMRIEALKLEQSFNDTSMDGMKELAQLEADRDEAFANAARERIALRKLETKVEKAANAEAKADDKDLETQKKEAYEALKIAQQEQELALKTQLADRLITQQQYEEQRLAILAASLGMEKELRQQFGDSTLDVEEQLLDLRIGMIEKETAAKDAASAKDQERTEQEKEAHKQLMEMRITSAVESAIAAVESAKTFKEATKAVLNSIRDSISGLISQGVTSVVTGAMKNVPFPFSLIAAPIAGAAAKALFTKLIPSFSEGGPTGYGSTGMGRNRGGNIRGMVEEGEYVIPRRLVSSDPMVANLVPFIESRRTGAGSSQSVAGASLGPLDTSGIERAAAAILQAAAVLTSQPIQAEFSRRSFKDAKDDDYRKEQNRNRGKIT